MRFLSGSKDGTARIWSFKNNKWSSIVLNMSTDDNKEKKPSQQQQQQSQQQQQPVPGPSNENNRPSMRRQPSASNSGQVSYQQLLV